MLKVKANPTFKAPVEIPRAGEAPAKITVEFRHKTDEEVDAFWQRANEEKLSNHAALCELIVGWEGVDTPFSPDALMQVLQNYQAAGQALIRAYFDELSGARKGN